MAYVNVINSTHPLKSPLEVRVCDTFISRLRGLTFHPPLKASEGIVLVQARDSRIDTAIHMLGVSMDLTIVWVNAANTVVDLIVARKWWTIHIPKSPARYIIECRPDRLADFNIGDELKLEHKKPRAFL